MKVTSTWIENTIKTFINKSPENNLKTNDNQKAWNEPIIGFSSAVDPLYLFYKKDIGNFYLLPTEIFAHSFPKTNYKPEQITVISWILPHTEKTRN